MYLFLRNTDEMSFADIEKNITLLGQKARDGKIVIDDLQGGTFTITNGGIYGSMLSTPILNPPQSAVLGMHNIIERPVVVNKGVLLFDQLCIWHFLTIIGLLMEKKLFHF